MNVDAEFWKTILDYLYDGVYVVNRDRTITYWNRGAERISGLTGDETVGTQCWENVRAYLDELERSRSSSVPSPRTDFGGDGLYHEEQVVVRHKEGHRIPVMTRMAVIRDVDETITGAVVLFSDNRAMTEARVKIGQLEKMALLDPLTQLGNRQYARAQLQRSLDELRRYSWPFGVLIVSLADFSKLSETHGVEVGEQALKTVAKTIGANVRSSDTIARWGTDELLVILLNMADSHLLPVATKLCGLVSESTVTIGTELQPLTVSIAATMGDPSDTVASIIEREERVIAHARAEGGNRVTVALSPQPNSTEPSEE
ncbi:MAG: diguanylate cyclase [Desulfomonile tiedjei]|nr:diguanylate cyclase [Desulfomonile tiedjei]